MPSSLPGTLVTLQGERTMLEAVDGAVVAVRDADAAAGTFRRLLGAEREDPLPSQVLAAGLTPMHVGTSRFLLAEPTGPGPTGAFLDRWGEGLLAAVLSTSDPRNLLSRLDEQAVASTHEDELLYLDTGATTHLRTIVVPHTERAPVGRLAFLYEVTHLVADPRRATRRWAEAFGLDEDRFCPISSEAYGYEGTLTLFDPPTRLDRIEVIRPQDPAKPMGRFFERRGEGAYMCFAECPDVPALAEHLDGEGARYAVGAEREGRPESIFVHPSSLHGVLLGVSRTDLAWRWSGRPELAG